MARFVLPAAAAAVILIAAGSFGIWRSMQPPQAAALAVRTALHAELQPVALSNCTLQRYGGAHDGGYLLCGNLIAGVESAYSYGISTEDNWGCQVSRQFHVPVHQYDCFTPHRPTCDGGEFVFHDECVGPKAETIDAQPFDSIASQIARNGDAGRRILLKIDVEGAEWDAFQATPDEVFERIDQIPMEFHGVDETRFLEMVRRLKRTFHLVNLHVNNYSCSPDAAPMAGLAYQVLWVNKRLGIVDPTAPSPAPSSPLNAPDNPNAPECPAS